MNTMSFINSDLNKQAQALEVRFSKVAKSYDPPTCFDHILRNHQYQKLNFYHHIFVRNDQLYIRLENLVY